MRTDPKKIRFLRKPARRRIAPAARFERSTPRSPPARGTRFGFGAEVALTPRGADACAVVVAVAGHVVEPLAAIVADVALDVAIAPRLPRREARREWLPSDGRPFANPTAERTPLSYNAAWRMRHKLMQVMMERDRAHPLGGFIQLDDAYLGGERSGGKRGRGAPGKTPFVAAVETNAEGHPLRVKLTVVEGFRLTEIAAWAQQHLSPGTQVLSDGLACFNGVTAAGCVHEPMVTGGGKAAVERPEFRWVNTILGNIKNALCGTYHAVRPKYAQRYLAEFEYRFNRRFDLPDIIPRLVYVALRTPPMPERLLKLRLA